MERRVFFDNIAQGKIAPCYVLEGPEEYIKRSALEALRKKLLPEGLEDINEARLTDPDANTLIAAAETLPFMAEKRLVVVQECGMLQGRAKGYDEARNAAALADYLQNPPDTACIVFYVRDKADGRKKLYTQLKKTAEIVQFMPLDDREMTRWIAQSLKKLGKQISAPTQSQAQVASFTLAVDRDFGGRDGGEKQTDFIDCVAWRQTAEFVSKYFTKGRMAVVSGRLQSRKWETREGEKRTSWEVVADNVYFGDSRRDGGEPGESRGSSYTRDYEAPKSSPKQAASPFEDLGGDDGELPF